MNNRILVTYATRAGSTVGVASAIAETLGQRGFAVDVKPVKEKPTLTGYQAVILGSAIRMGQWLPEMKDYIKSNQAALGKLPVALFTVHMSHVGDDETSRSARQAYVAPIHALLTPADEAFFAGKMDFNTLSFMDRLIMQAIKGKGSSEAEDLRDWGKIRGWANSVTVTAS